MEAMQNDVITMPNMSKGMSTIEVWKNRMPITKGTRTIPELYRNPLKLSPKTTALRDTGAERRRSNVFVLRSIGIETGSIDDAENRMVIAISPAINIAGVAVLPTEKARNMNNGNSMPETIMLGFT